jgi:hypothetical protein
MPRSPRLLITADRSSQTGKDFANEIFNLNQAGLAGSAAAVFPK